MSLPESTAGGALALVQNGDEIEVNVEARKLELCVPPNLNSAADAKLGRRQRRLPAVDISSSTSNTFCRRTKARTCDFLVGCRGRRVPRESH